MEKFANLSRNMFLAMVFGALIGFFIPQVAPYVSFLGLTFKLSLSMIVMPIILTSLLCGLESVGDFSRISGLGSKTLIYFISSMFIAIIIGLFLVSIIKPGIKEPSLAIKSIISGIKSDSNEELVSEISTKISYELGEQTPGPIHDDLKESLSSLIKNGSTELDIKNSALRLVGSLDLRSHLEKDHRPAQIQSMSMSDFVTAQIKKALVNPFEALAQKDVLAVIIFTLLLGGAMTTIGPLGRQFFEINRAINMSISKIVELIMLFAPFGVFGLIVDVVASTGVEVFLKLGMYALCVVLGLALHLFIVLPAINYYFSGVKPKEFFSAMKPAMAVAFSTSSSSAALPVTMHCVEHHLKVAPRISHFVLPLGSTINMDGTALYEAVAAVFIAQLYGVSLGLESQVIVAITAALAAIGAAGIPAAGTVTMALVLSAVGLPVEGVGILLAIDRPLDMCRTVVNVMGDATGCLVLKGIEQKKQNQIT